MKKLDTDKLLKVLYIAIVLYFLVSKEDVRKLTQMLINQILKQYGPSKQ
ncbi:hypothetical protein [Corallibacter sp.]